MIRLGWWYPVWNCSLKHFILYAEQSHFGYNQTIIYWSCTSCNTSSYSMDMMFKFVCIISRVHNKISNTTQVMSIVHHFTVERVWIGLYGFQDFHDRWVADFAVTLSRSAMPMILYYAYNWFQLLHNYVKIDLPYWTWLTTHVQEGIVIVR